MAVEPGELVLFTHPWAQNPLKVRFLLASLRLPFQAKYVPLDEERPAWYIEINPYRRLPTLVAGDLVLAESNAILRYLAAHERREDLYPTDLAQRARVDWALDAWSTQTRPALSAIEAAALWHSNLEGGGGDWREGDQEAIAAATPKALAALQVMEEVVADNGTFLGRMSIADYSVAPVLTRTYRLPLDLSPFPRLTKMRDLLASHPDFVHTAPEGWSSPAGGIAK
jgi:glutathione S-transferase